MPEGLRTFNSRDSMKLVLRDNNVSLSNLAEQYKSNLQRKASEKKLINILDSSGKQANQIADILSQKTPRIMYDQGLGSSFMTQNQKRNTHGFENTYKNGQNKKNQSTLFKEEKLGLSQSHQALEVYKNSVSSFMERSLSKTAMNGGPRAAQKNFESQQATYFKMKPLCTAKNFQYVNSLEFTETSLPASTKHLEAGVLSKTQ